MFGLFIIGHQGGWDEILYVAGPVLLIAGLLLIAHRRANRLSHRLGDSTDHTSDAGESAN